MTAVQFTPADDAGDAARSAIEQAFYQAVYQTVVFPAAEIGVGAVWTVRQQISGGVTLDQVTTATLTELDGNRATVALDITQTPRANVWNLPDGAGMLDIEEYLMHGTGTVTLDLELPLPVDGRIETAGEQRYRDPERQIDAAPVDEQPGAMGRLTLVAAGVAVLCGVAACAVAGCGSSSPDSTAIFGGPVAGAGGAGGCRARSTDRATVPRRRPVARCAAGPDRSAGGVRGTRRPGDSSGCRRRRTTTHRTGRARRPPSVRTCWRRSATRRRDRWRRRSSATAGRASSSVDADAASYSEAAVGHVFGAVQELLARCESYSGTDADGVAVEYRVGGLDLAGVAGDESNTVAGDESNTVGDASTSVRVVTTSEGFTLVSDVVIGVVGSTVFAVSATRDTPFDPAFVTELGRVQAERLRGTLGP